MLLNIKVKIWKNGPRGIKRYLQNTCYIISSFYFYYFWDINDCALCYMFHSWNRKARKHVLHIGLNSIYLILTIINIHSVSLGFDNKICILYKGISY